MARIKKKGEAGAAKAYVTRSAAIKKLQCTLADFRRLCILKGIFPREPRHKKKANKGSSAPTSFYYAKDIAYLAHEPVLRKLREHKAFAKRFARALGRGEWSSAKSLEDSKPIYTIDHIIKERYPSFIDAVRDIDDGLCMIFLFASLPSSSRLPATLVESCAKLAAQWQLYVMKSQSLRKVFFSIKGVYYQVEVMGEVVTWLVPYMFTQNIPTDVDVRVMLTFLELYQTLLGFVMFKLYTDLGLVYPPPLDLQRDQEAAGLGAFTLQETSAKEARGFATHQPSSFGKNVTGKVVREAIKRIERDGPVAPALEPMLNEDDFAPMESTEQFTTQPSSSEGVVSQSDLLTLHVINNTPSTFNTTLFKPFTFFLSRETPRPLFEFMVRSFGGRIGWAASQGGGSTVKENDDSITHVIIDRPVPPNRGNEGEEDRLRRLRRKYVQPQWVADCINAGKILPEDDYSQGKMLPPHLSPFGEGQGAYEPRMLEGAMDTMQADPESDAESESSAAKGVEEVADTRLTQRHFHDIEGAVDDLNLLYTAEVTAEASGVDADEFNKIVSKALKHKNKAGHKKAVAEQEEREMGKMLMSNKQRKLYEKLRYSEKKRATEKKTLEQRRQKLQKSQKSQS